MTSRARSSITAILALVGILSSFSFALAEDYSVDFGADTDRGRDAGTMTCRFDYPCHGKMESLGLKVSVDIARRFPDSARVRLEAGDLGCCYFAAATTSIGVDSRSLSRRPLFRGSGPMGGLFIANEPAGTLYLRFHFN